MEAINNIVDATSLGWRLGCGDGGKRRRRWRFESAWLIALDGVAAVFADLAQELVLGGEWPQF